MKQLAGVRPKKGITDRGTNDFDGKEAKFDLRTRSFMIRV